MVQSTKSARYIGYVDVARGADAFAFALARIEGERVHVERIVEDIPPFVRAAAKYPRLDAREAAIASYCDLLREHGQRTCGADRDASLWVEERVRRHGITLQLSDQDRPDIFMAFAAMRACGDVVLQVARRT